MPFLEVNIAPGRDADAKAALIADLTEVVVRHLGVPAPTVAVLIREEPAENWGRGGLSKTALDRKRAAGEDVD
ncbi:4-oxalocrotonate tautomerase family protein [Jannaschia sp. LMIT008]|uniref:tautomerase family protein n=1 Tax=Jannaschia maritima TaxID=3032585 RepID=UPI002810E790|nr:4-oxalocrotonate tautomerase family protein [Jannaschia sp. LMIT008]